MSTATSEARSFAELIRLLDRGEFAALLDANLGEIREALSDHAQAFGGGKAEASLTLRLDFKFDRGAIAVKSKTDTTLPKPPPGSTTLWMGREGFAQSDPQQPSLFGARVVTGDVEVRTPYVRGTVND